MKLRPVAIAERRAADHADLAFELDLADALQLLPQDLDFAGELVFVRRVLIVAAAASREQRAGGVTRSGAGVSTSTKRSMDVLTESIRTVSPGSTLGTSTTRPVDTSQALRRRKPTCRFELRVETSFTIGISPNYT